LRKTFDSMNKLAAEMDVMLEKINRGQGLAGAMFSDKTNGQELLAQVKGAAISMKETSEKMNQLVDRFNNGNGAVQRLISDQQYANQLLSNMQTSLADMKDLLHKINDGKGSVGLAVNDPSLYYEAKSFLSGGGSLGWGVKMLNGAYTVTHPFSRNSPTDELILTPAPSSQSAPANQAPPKP
jgi:phospholipid/cholesterol/gamma-HCH transport system substrate-binding protein